MFQGLLAKIDGSDDYLEPESTELKLSVCKITLFNMLTFVFFILFSLSSSVYRMLLTKSYTCLGLHAAFYIVL